MKAGFVGYNLFMKYRKVGLRDVWEVVWRILVFAIMEVISAVYLVEKGLIWVWVVVLIGLLAWLVNWHCEYFGYECEKCGHRQKINFWKEFGSINLVNKKYLKCEKCRKWSKAKLLVVE